MFSIAADDLMSLLDAGMHSAAAAADHSGVIIDSENMFGGEEMFSYSSLRNRPGARVRNGQFFSINGSLINRLIGGCFCFSVC